MTQRRRRARPTIRCLTEDLARPLPSLEVDLGYTDHPLMDGARRLAATSPRGQKRIELIDHPMVYRLRHSTLRGATWVDDDNDVLWLLGAGLRGEGSPDDAYEHFEALHRAGRLLPTDDDFRRDRAEAATRFLQQITRAAALLLNRARAAAGTEHPYLLAGEIEVRLLVARGSGMEEIWLAVSRRDVDGHGVPARVRDMIFAIFEQAVGQAEWEWRADWPVGELRWFETARLGVREA